MDLDLKDVHVLVTGANGGIGLETTRLFLEHGAHVTAHYRSSNAALSQLISETSHEHLRMVQADLSHEAQVQALFARPGNTGWGEVEIAVVNHGVSDVPLKDMPIEQWERTFSNNLTSSFLVAREYLRGLERGVRAGPKMETGAMMYGLALSLKNEIVRVAPRARVNCVAPGWVRTPMASEALQDPQTVYRSLATVPLRKVAEASDVANQIVLLASAKVSGHVTGQVLMVEGGMKAWCCICLLISPWALNGSSLPPTPDQRD
ncbi:NAD-P-binding protein, partial [Lactarius pseudohatsudake]